MQECATNSAPTLHSDIVTAVAGLTAVLALVSHVLRLPGSFANVEVAFSVAGAAAGWALALACATMPHAMNWLAEPPLTRASSLPFVVTLSLVPGVIASLLVLPALRLAKCFIDAQCEAAYGGGGAGVRLRAVLLAAALGAPFLFIFSLAPGGVASLAQVFIARGPTTTNEAAASAVRLLQTWAAIASLAILLFCGLRPALATFLTAPRRRMAEQLVAVGGKFRRLIREVEAAQPQSQLGTPTLPPALSPSSLELVMRELTVVALRPQVAVTLVALHLLAPVLLFSSFTALIARQGGEGFGTCSAMKASLKAAGVHSLAWGIAPFAESTHTDMDSLRTMLHDIFPTTSALMVPAEIRKVLVWMTLPSAAVYALSLLCGVVYWDRIALTIAGDTRAARTDAVGNPLSQRSDTTQSRL